MFGQVINTDKSKLKAILQTLSRELDLDYSHLYESYNELEVYDEAKISSAANILKTATRSLWLSEYIEIGYNTSASKIDSFIRSHLSEDLSVKRLCDEFAISKNKLYETSHQSFQMSIGDYITTARIDEAKQLLTTTDYPITQISAMVGIKNYNYFTKFFKTNVGISPLKYRKTVHF